MRNLCALAAGVLVGCASTSAPSVAPEPVSLPLSAGRAWDAVLAELTAEGISVRALERASGLVASTRSAVPQDRSAWLGRADCGTALGLAVPPSTVEYTVTVRGDSTSALVTPVARFVYADARGDHPCTSSGRWERDFLAALRRRAAP